MADKYVLTGGPGVGKSTTLAQLGKIGYCTFADVAAFLIECEQRKEKPILPWTDRDGFQRKVLQTQLEWEREIPSHIKTVILDRGVLDGLAYYRIGGLQPPKELLEAAKHTDYKKVFLLERLTKYENTTTKSEDTEHAKKLHEEIANVYMEYGYKLIMVPEATLQERIEIIRKEIKD